MSWFVASRSANTSASSSAIAAPGPCSASWRGRRPRRAPRDVRPGRRHDLLDRGEVRVVGVPQQSRHRVGEVEEQPAPLSPASVCRLTRVDVGVAVDTAFAERDGEEDAASAQHHRPIGDLGESVRDESPACLSPARAQDRQARGHGWSSGHHRHRQRGRRCRSSRRRSAPAPPGRRHRVLSQRARGGPEPRSPRGAPRAAPLGESRHRLRHRPSSCERRCRRAGGHGGRETAAARSDSHEQQAPPRSPARPAPERCCQASTGRRRSSPTRASAPRPRPRSPAAARRGRAPDRQRPHRRSAHAVSRPLGGDLELAL